MSTIRPFTPGDYSAVVAIDNAVFTEYPRTVDEVRFQDEHREPKCKFARFVCELGGGLVAHGEYSQSSHTYHPRVFNVHVTVAPEHQGCGIGAALYDHIVDALRPFDPLRLRSHCREDMLRGMRFLQDRSFVDDMRSWESRLEVEAFDHSPYEGTEEKVRAHGIEIKTLRELESDPDYQRKLHDLFCELDQDVPSPEPPTRTSFEVFAEHTFKNPNLLPDAFFVALDHGEYIGTSNLWSSQGNDDIYTGLTGVKRSHRRMGVALALKLRGIAWAQSQGRKVVKTWNESNNRPMLSINEMLGYVKQPAWVSFVKVVKEVIETS